MLDDILNQVIALIQWDWRATAVATFLSPFFFTYLVTTLRSSIALNKKVEGRAPPISPYAMPVFGNLVEFLYDACQTAGNVRSKFGIGVPVRLRLFDRYVYLISGQKHTQSLFRQARDLTTAPNITEILVTLFGSPASINHIYTRDETGSGHQPLPGSEDIGAHNRTFQMIHESSSAGLSGPGLAGLASRFVSNLEEKLLALDVGDEWVHIPDLYKLVRIAVFEASTSALCGPHLFRINPDFADEFWQYDRYLLKFVNKYPKWLIPEGYALREKILKTLIQWHDFANDNNDPSKYIDGEYDEYFGAKIMKNRQTLFTGVDGMTKEGLAAQDLGLLWAANANVVPLLGWTLLDILLRPKLTTTVLSTIASTPPTTSRLNVPALCSSPLLQSIYSEELRLRSSSFIQRVPVTKNFRLGDYAIPKGDTIFASSWHEARDPAVWNQGTNSDPHSVDDFWAERFLLYSDDPFSGPGKPSLSPSKPTDTKLSSPRPSPKYTTDSVTQSLFPYGGGANLCPGRFYAKQEAMAGAAMFLSIFEIELDAVKEGVKPETVKPNMKDFPVGVLHPTGTFPARMRRRKVVASGKA